MTVSEVYVAATQTGEAMDESEQKKMSDSGHSTVSIFVILTSCESHTVHNGTEMEKRLALLLS